MSEHTFEDSNLAGSEKVLVSYPSEEFPGPPAISLSLPADWVNIEPKDYVQPVRKIDFAVCGPEPINGVTPAISGNLIRSLPAANVETFLTQMLGQEVTELHSARLQASHYQATPEPTVAAVIRDFFPGKEMEYLQILKYMHGPKIAHVLSLSGVYAAGSEEGQKVIFDIIAPPNFGPADASQKQDHPESQQVSGKI